jgi:hypothetical protein
MPLSSKVVVWILLAYFSQFTMRMWSKEEQSRKMWKLGQKRSASNAAVKKGAAAEETSTFKKSSSALYLDNSKDAMRASQEMERPHL